MRHTLNKGSWWLAALLVFAAGPAAAQSISGFSVSTAGSTGNSGNGDGATTSSVAIQTNTATQVKSRFAWNVNADTGVGSTRDQSGNAQHNVSFSVTAPGSYFLTVATQFTGDMNRVSDLSLCEGQSNVSGVTGTFGGGTLQAGGSLSIADPGALGNGTGNGNTPFNTSASAQINRTSNGAAQAHTLTFTWNGSVRSNSCEAAIRVGEQSGATSGCSACGYPGSPSRTQASDGHFETVTLTNLCGNSVVDTSGTFTGITSEQCDQGGLNGTAGSCCTSTCQFRAAGQVCRAVAGVCDVQETCTGAAATCPVDAFVPNTTPCRGSAGVCDIVENCTGSGAACPADAFQPNTTPCRASAGVCDLAENCTGSGAACPADAKSTAVCRGAAGICDVAESCDGVGNNCPADAVEPATTECRPSAGVCDVAENCTGSGTACPADAFEPATTECRAAAGVCDLAENCTGSGAACPADAKSSAVCRAAAGVCDVAESCDGVSDNCPADAVEPASTTCRGAAGICDLAENCDGTGVNCPADSVSGAFVTCRPSAGPCDVAENCDGSNSGCPADAVEPASTTCRAAAGACDVAENCDGATVNCPADSVSGAFVTCRPIAGICDLAENCDGSNTGCPADAFQPNSTTCRGSAGVCDLAETCTGSGAACPADAKSTAVCRGSAGICDVAETCDGVTDTCPADAFQPASTVCRASANACDIAETCTGSSAACPADTGQPDGDTDTVCDAIDNCDTIANTDQANGDSDSFGDACDPCTNIVPTVPSKTKLILSKLLLPATDDKLNFKGFFTAVPNSPPVNPIANGLRVLVSDSLGNTPIDVTIPGGAYNPATRIGWKVNGSGTAWKYSNSTSPVNGLYKAQLKAYSSTPGKYKFGVKGKNGNYVVNTANLPLKGTLVIDVPFAETGQCGETAFQTPPTKPNCSLTGGGKNVKCK